MALGGDSAASEQYPEAGLRLYDMIQCLLGSVKLHGGLYWLAKGTFLHP